MIPWTVHSNSRLPIRWPRVLTVGVMTGCSCILLGAAMADLAHWSRPPHGLETSAPSGEWIGSTGKVDDQADWFAMSACCQASEPMTRADAASPLVSSASPVPADSPQAVEQLAVDERGHALILQSLRHDLRRDLAAMAATQHTGRWAASCPCPMGREAAPSPAPRTDLWVNDPSVRGNPPPRETAPTLPCTGTETESAHRATLPVCSSDGPPILPLYPQNGVT